MSCNIKNYSTSYRSVQNIINRTNQLNTFNNKTYRISNSTVLLEGQLNRIITAETSGRATILNNIDNSDKIFEINDSIIERVYTNFDTLMNYKGKQPMQEMKSCANEGFMEDVQIAGCSHASDLNMQPPQFTLKDTVDNTDKSRISKISGESSPLKVIHDNNVNP